MERWRQWCRGNCGTPVELAATNPYTPMPSHLASTSTCTRARPWRCRWLQRTRGSSCELDTDMHCRPLFGMTETRSDPRRYIYDTRRLGVGPNPSTCGNADIAGDVLVSVVGFDVCGEVFVVDDGISISGDADFIALVFGFRVFEKIMVIAGEVFLDGSRVVTHSEGVYLRISTRCKEGEDFSCVHTILG
ncbi:hypothetical protein FVEG_17156 [Fusarium verticillioides 7600]|uniref:Uncharacterized protein n=1 Tax=Gibberella moniliformis (strain M3125 / FGSC 7600) TaxID=334819 RepID=W7NAZ3_GIBM7|nr:hypothetical protein FVEG_17156 [Fusarium verticillioides 7600]EWG53657.1 hypothetical protein FVEG_17156 [Fusarium verticillioides 7600]